MGRLFTHVPFIGLSNLSRIEHFVGLQDINEADALSTPYGPYAMTSSNRHLRGKTVTKQLNRTDLYARCTGLANEQPPFDL